MEEAAEKDGRRERRKRATWQKEGGKNQCENLLVDGSVR